MIEQRLLDVSSGVGTARDMRKLALAEGLYYSLLKEANPAKVKENMESGMGAVQAVKTAYPNYTPEQVSQYLKAMGKTASVDLEKVAYLPWLSRMAISRGGGRAAKAGEKYLLRRAGRTGRKANVAQRTAATEAGMTPAHIRRSAISEGRAPVMDAKREIAKLQSGAGKRFAQPSAMESARMRMPGAGGAEKVMSGFGTAAGGHGGAGLGTRNILGQYLQGGPGRRGMIAGGMDMATALGQGGARLGRGAMSGIRSGMRQGQNPLLGYGQRAAGYGRAAGIGGAGIGGAGGLGYALS